LLDVVRKTASARSARNMHGTLQTSLCGNRARPRAARVRLHAHVPEYSWALYLIGLTMPLSARKRPDDDQILLKNGHFGPKITIFSQIWSFSGQKGHSQIGEIKTPQVLRLPVEATEPIRPV
jgi:hypothetical protein